MLIHKYTSEINDWANAIEIVGGIPEEGGYKDRFPISVEERVEPKLLVAITSTPEGLRPSWLDAKINLVDPNGRRFPRGEDSKAAFSDNSGSLIIINKPDAGPWTLEIESNGSMPFAVNAASYHLIPSEFAQSPAASAVWCTACKMTAKALGIAIFVAVTSAQMPQAIISAVAIYLGVSHQFASVFVSSVLGDTANRIAEKLCKITGLC